MSTIRLTKEFKFEAAHALWNYDGLCKNIHGHSFRLFVTIKGSPINETDNPKNGMVMDFGNLKTIVNEEIVSVYDHSVIISNKAFDADLEKIDQMFKRIIVTGFQPTCENMVSDFAEKIMKRLPERIKLHSIKLNETASSFAEWYAEDN